jgi:hypothetical protein
MADKFTPPLNVLIALGSLAVHIEELLETPSTIKGKTLADILEAHSQSAAFDLAAIRQNLDVPGLQEWRAEMDRMAFLPKKRH